jgi:hypothetical protein
MGVGGGAVEQQIDRLDGAAGRVQGGLERIGAHHRV